MDGLSPETNTTDVNIRELKLENSWRRWLYATDKTDFALRWSRFTNINLKH